MISSLDEEIESFYDNDSFSQKTCTKWEIRRAIFSIVKRKPNTNIQSIQPITSFIQEIKYLQPSREIIFTGRRVHIYHRFHRRWFLSFDADRTPSSSDLTPTEPEHRICRGGSDDGLVWMAELNKPRILMLVTFWQYNWFQCVYYGHRNQLWSGFIQFSHPN